MKLFHGWLSSASRRVRLCLAEKGIDYESVPVDLAAQEHHSPAFLAMNPNGVVPALVLDDGRFLYESSTLCEYLDETFPTPSLRPADAYVRAQMRNFVRWTDDHALPHLLILNWSLALQPVASQWSDDALATRLARIPTATRREAWLRIARKPYTDDEKRHALESLLALMPKMETSLVNHPWLMGDDYSLADIAAVPFVARIAELAPQALTPAVSDWWRRIQDRPAFALANIHSFNAALQARSAMVQ
ncbi:glutathione S-transferase family protein [Cupriavidus sp. SW-Y-13]|uniref:glutathione S-transferase family protein n=1 Tax=Cupriavidus sp. SW-Y-13 TaxID=2653854 RepID=UPI001365BBC3|nr:glutathione S-transferase family protein [Cupriavidus sp. SW-Y-13]MWL87735.1 glutathione S-transferase family protein [Cupriavidus sp. SW-Y-13]